MVLTGSDNLFPLVRVVEDAEDSTPTPSGEIHLRADSATKLLYAVDDAGVVTPLGTGAGAYTPGGTDVAVGDGGTGASTAAGARTNLGLVIGTHVSAPIADILDLPTAETDDTLVLAPDGAGGVEFRAEAGGGGGSSPFYLDSLALDGTHGDDFTGATLDAIWTPTGAFDAQAARYAYAGTWLCITCRGTAAESIYQTGPTKETFEVIAKHSGEGSNGYIAGPAIVSATGTGVGCAIRPDVSQFHLYNVAAYAYTSDGASVAIGGGNALMDYGRGLPIWLSLRKVPTALDGDIYFARYSLNGNTWSRVLHYDPATFTYAKLGWGRLNGGANNDQLALDRYNVIDALDVGNNLCATPVGGGTVTATASSAFGGFPASNAINGTSADWSPNNGATDYAGAGLWLDIAWSVGQTMNRVVYKERGGDVWGKGHIEITHAGGTAIIPCDEFIGGSSKWHVQDFADLTGVTAVRMVCDGSPGANPGFIEVETYLRS